MRAISVFLVIIFTSIFAWGSDPANTFTFSVQEVENFRFDVQQLPTCEQKSSVEAFGLLNPFEKSKVSQIVNLGKLTYQIISENSASIDVVQMRSSAVPNGISWDELECWKRPETKSFHVVATNGYGIEVVSFEYDIRYTYGGHYKGVGAYLKNVTIIPTSIDVLWGYKVNVSVSVPSTVNMGTTESPLAGSELQLDYTIHTLVKASRRSMSYFITGDGILQELD